MSKAWMTLKSWGVGDKLLIFKELLLLRYIVLLLLLEDVFGVSIPELCRINRTKYNAQ